MALESDQSLNWQYRFGKYESYDNVQREGKSKRSDLDCITDAEDIFFWPGLYRLPCRCLRAAPDRHTEFGMSFTTPKSWTEFWSLPNCSGVGNMHHNSARGVFPCY